MLGKLVTATRRGSDVVLYFRTEEGKKKITVKGFKPYFYVVDAKGSYTSLFGEKLKRVYVSLPENVPSAREKYSKHYEADIPYTRRFLIDRDIYSYAVFPDDKNVVSPSEIKSPNSKLNTDKIKLRIWYVDIEVFSGGAFPNIEEANQPITEITVFDSYTNRYMTLICREDLQKAVHRKGNVNIITYNDEYDMLFDFARLINKLEPDIITGWNVKNFDVEYLRNRCNNLGINIDLSGIDVFDLMEAYKKLFSRSSYALKEIAILEGLIGKDEVIWQSEIDKLYKEDINKYIKYNFNDVRFVVEIDKKHKIIDFYQNIREVTGVVHLDDTFKYSVLVDTMLLRLARKEGVVLPSVKREEYKKYPGALCIEPKAGIYEGVAVFDMSRYYPQIIISFNLSPEMKREDGDIIVNGLKIRSEPTGIIPKLVLRLFRERDKLEDMLQKLTPGTAEYNSVKMKRNSVKFLINAIYGYMSYVNSRLYDLDIAATVTMIGREGIEKSKEIAKAMGFETIYGDTDSILIQAPFEECNKIMNKINNELASYFENKYNLKHCTIKLKFEKYYKRMLFKDVKKRYAGLVVWEKGKECSYVSTVGFEAIRTDQSRYTRKIQRQLLEMIVLGKTKDEIIEFLNKISEETV